VRSNIVCNVFGHTLLPLYFRLNIMSVQHSDITRHGSTYWSCSVDKKTLNVEVKMICLTHVTDPWWIQFLNVYSGLPNYRQEASRTDKKRQEGKYTDKKGNIPTRKKNIQTRRKNNNKNYNYRYFNKQIYIHLLIYICFYFVFFLIFTLHGW
jgi:hypothetical protein